MASPELELQSACVKALKDDATLSAIVNKRIYDLPPSAATFPYVEIGEAQFLRDDATCINGGRTYLTMHAWSDKVGYPEVKAIADAVVEAIHLNPLTLPTNRLVSIMHQQTRVFRDSDGLKSHAVIEFVANTEKVA
jgi:hypothetical protein